MEPNNIDIIVLNNPNNLGLCLSRLLGKDKRITVTLMDFSPLITLPYTPTYIFYLIKNFSLEISNVLFVQQKYKHSIIIPVARDYDYYEASVLYSRKIYYPLTYDTCVPVLKDFLINISDKAFREFSEIEDNTRNKFLSEIQDVMTKYYGKQNIDYKHAAVVYNYLILHKNKVQSKQFINKKHITNKSLIQKHIKKIFEFYNGNNNKKILNLDIEVPEVSTFDIDNYKVPEAEIDSGKDEKYLLPTIHAVRTRRRLWKPKK